MVGIDWNFIWEILPQLLKAIVVTIQATFTGFAFAIVAGLIMALGRRSKTHLISWTMGALVEFIRSTPLLVQLFFLYYVLPRYGIKLSTFVVGTLGLGLHYGSYTSEVYRAGIEAVSHGQWEAATALNFSTKDTLIKIILPQAIRPMVPALGNYLISMFKETPQLSVITVMEMFQRAKIISSQTFRPLEPYTMVGILFFLLSFPSALLLRKLEDRLVGTERA